MTLEERSGSLDRHINDKGRIPLRLYWREIGPNYGRIWIFFRHIKYPDTCASPDIQDLLRLGQRREVQLPAAKHFEDMMLEIDPIQLGLRCNGFKSVY